MVFAVVVLGSRSGDEVNLMTANWLTQTSFDPPYVCVAIQEEAHTRAAQIEQQQVARIQQEAARARAELSRLVVNLSISAAGKVISKSVDSSDNRRLVEEFVHANETREQ